MANLLINLKKQASTVVRSILEAQALLHRDLECAQSLEITEFAANLTKFSLGMMIHGKGMSDCKSHALATLLGHKRTWVASFGVAAAVACWAYERSAVPEDVLLHSMSPWHDKPYEMWHMCRCVLVSDSKCGLGVHVRLGEHSFSNKSFNHN